MPAHVRLEASHVQAQIESLQTRQPELVAAQSMPAWRLGIHRYSNAATYVVLTAVIVVPLIWLGLNGVLKRDIARLAPLNATPVSAQSTELVGVAPSEHARIPHAIRTRRPERPQQTLPPGRPAPGRNR